MHILEKVKRHGISGSIRKAANAIGNISGFTRWRFRKEPFYVDPTPDELMDIECDLKNMGVIVQDYYISPSEFNKFQEEQWFPSDYHGGINGPVWYEKLLEHFIASKLLGLMSYGNEDVFIDVAAGGSPWCHMLRLRKAIKAFAIDLSEYYEPYKSLPYYLVQNATCTTFADSSVKGMALHCAFEMFMRDDDIAFIREASRILLPKGKIIIVPLYMHTHYCAYSSPEYYGKHYSDPLAKEYIRFDGSGIPSSRKYDAINLKKRVLDIIISNGMHYRILALRNKAELGDRIYCHFILEIEK